MVTRRWLRNLFVMPGSVARAFPASSFAAIERAIADAEKLHGGEIRFAVEAALEPQALLRGHSARDRAIQAFSELRVWDTEHNSGVLIYLLLAEHDIEIVADRGYNGRVSPAEWEQVCRHMEAQLAAGRYEEAVSGGVRDICALIAPAFPPRAGDTNELPDTPVAL